jgi:hypothetical protein
MEKANSSQSVKTISKFKISVKILMHLIQELPNLLHSPNVKWLNLKYDHVSGNSYLNAGYFLSDAHWTAFESAQFCLAFHVSRTQKGNAMKKDNARVKPFINALLENLGLKSEMVDKKRKRKSHQQYYCIDQEHSQLQLKMVKGIVCPSHWGDFTDCFDWMVDEPTAQLMITAE